MKFHPCVVKAVLEYKSAYLCGGFFQTLPSDPEMELTQLSSSCSDYKTSTRDSRASLTY